MKRIISLCLIVAMVCSLGLTTFATNDYTQGTQVVYNGTGTEAYTITVPAELKPGQSGIVTLSGTWADNRILTVTADATVTLTNSINANDKKVLDVTFDGISAKGSNIEIQTFTKTVGVEDITNALFGTWSGKFYYNVELADDTKTGLRFGEKYVLSSVVNGNGMPVDWFIYYEDGSVDMFVNGVLQKAPAGFVEYQDGKIIVPGGEMSISADGTVITESDDTGYCATWTLESTFNTPLKFGEPYVCVQDGYNEGVLGSSWYLFADGSARIVLGDVTVPIESGFYQYVGNRIISKDEQATSEIIVSDDGNTITQIENGVVMSIFERVVDSDFKYGENYILTYLYPQFSDMLQELPTELMGYEDGTASVVVAGQHMTLPQGYFTIKGNEIDLGSSDESEKMLICDNGNTISFQLDGVEVARWEITESPIKFGEKYILTRMDNSSDLGSAFVLNEDGSVNVYAPNGELMDSMPAGTFGYSGVAILPLDSSLDMGVLICSEDGNSISGYMNGELVIQFLLGNYTNSSTPLKYGQRYVYNESPYPALIGVWIMFNLDGSITSNLVQNKPQTSEAGYFIANETELTFKDQDENEKYLISADGETLTFIIDEETTYVLKLETSISTPLKMNDEYILAYATDELEDKIGETYIFRANGSIETSFLEATEPGYATYTQKEIVTKHQLSSVKNLISADGNHVVEVQDGQINTVILHNSVYKDSTMFKNTKYLNQEIINGDDDPNMNYAMFTDTTFATYFVGDDSINIGPLNIYYVGQAVYGIADDGEKTTVKIGEFSADGKTFYLLNFFGDNSIIATFICS